METKHERFLSSLSRLHLNLQSQLPADQKSQQELQDSALQLQLQLADWQKGQTLEKSCSQKCETMKQQLHDKVQELFEDMSQRNNQLSMRQKSLQEKFHQLSMKAESLQHKLLQDQAQNCVQKLLDVSDSKIHNANNNSMDASDDNSSPPLPDGELTALCCLDVSCKERSSNASYASYASYANNASNASYGNPSSSPSCNTEMTPA